MNDLPRFGRVRVRHLRRPAVAYGGWTMNRRPPQVGDMGVVLDLFPGAVWDRCSDLLTPFEHRAGHAILGRQKLARAGADRAHPLMARWGLVDDPEVNAALVDGPDEFRLKVCRRVLAEHGTAFVNRCPRCGKVVRTTKAMQCFWCGHSWHGENT